jgi:hypothetical protein
VTCRLPHPVWLAALSLWASACVLPVGPQFGDPAGNSPPYLDSSNPVAGSVLPTASPTIEVTVGDANLEDRLYGRWLIDYPPQDGRSRLASEFRLPPTDALTREIIRFAPNCQEHKIASGEIPHRVTLSVADRQFLPPDPASPELQFDTVPPEGFLLRTTWILPLVCP